VGNDAAERLAELLADRGDLDGATQVLRAGADAGNVKAARQLADLLLERGDVDGLRARADAGDSVAAWRLADLLEKRGDLDGPRRYYAPRPTPATRLPPGSCRTCWPSTAAARNRRSCAGSA
jgi:hypothetical protein